MAGENFTEVDAFFASVAFRFQTYGLAAMQEWYSAGLLNTEKLEKRWLIVKRDRLSIFSIRRLLGKSPKNTIEKKYYRDTHELRA